MMRRRDLLALIGSAPFAIRANPLQQVLASYGAIASAMPTGALGIWYADQYSSTNKAIPNAALSNTPKPNYLRASRRLFSKAIFWGNSGCTVTDDAAVGPDGLTEASTVVAAANWNMQYVGGSNITIAAGTYTMAAYVKRNTGTDQQFKMGDFQSTRSATLTATSAWQRFTHTFTTVGTVNILFISFDNATGANIQICDVELYAGSSDLGPVGADGNMYVGPYATSTKTPVAANEIDLSVQGSRCVALLPTGATGTAFTAMALVRKVAADTVGPAVSRAQNFADFTLETEVSNSPGSYAKGSLSGVLTSTSGMWNLLNVGYHVITFNVTGSLVEIWLDDVRMFSQAGTTTSFQLRDLIFGMGSDNSFSGFKMNSAAVYPGMTAAQIRQAVAFLRARGTSNGLTMANARVLVGEGDSITYWTGSPATYPYVYGASASPTFLGRTFAQPGNSVADLVARAASVDAVIPPSPNGRKFILSVLIGHNDLQGLGLNPWCAALAAYLDARRAAGWIVVLCTLLPSTIGGFNAARNLANPELRLWTTSGSIVPGKHADYICDFAADPVMGIDGNGSTTGPWNTTNYSDGTHPTQTGQNLLAADFGAVANTI